MGGWSEMVVDDGTELLVPGDDGSGLPADMGAEEALALDATISLPLSELLPDAMGEIVIVGDGEDTRLQIVTDLRLLDSGVSEQHLTAGGLQVDGFNYWVFEDGTKLYYAPGTSIEIEHQQA
jgi:hypothetical protein